MNVLVKKKNSISIIEKYIANTLYIWSDVKDSNLKKVNQQINELDNRIKSQKGVEVIFSKIKGANHFFKEKENELRVEIEKYIKEKTALI